MAPHSSFGSAQPVDPTPENTQNSATQGHGLLSQDQGTAASGQALDPQDLEAALQLLVDRAQYITGATGAALAIARGPEMVCRASAGLCAPPVGARLQVRSGLTGESVSRKQLLRCDNAENDPRVNLETCRELGIASIVVLPLLSAKGEVRGLFELFSDHPYAFEERDLIALERMAELTRTALDLAEKTPLVTPPRVERETSSAVEQEPRPDATSSGVPAVDLNVSALVEKTEPVPATLRETALQTTKDVTVGDEALVETQFPAPPSASVVAVPALLPESMRRVQKCSSCGFPVSEGRTLCVDCENKQHGESGGGEIMLAEYVPSFGLSTSSEPVEESWLANHVNILAIVVLILSIVVAVVVFR